MQLPMADTNHHGHAEPARVEGDGISYANLGWSMVILALITLACYLIVWGFFVFMDSRQTENDPARNPLAPAQTMPSITDGRITSGNQSPTPLLVNEPANLQKFRAKEHETLTTYGWVDQNEGTVRIPIAVAKDKLMQQGLPVRAGGL
jgi:hypothetical protein